MRKGQVTNSRTNRDYPHQVAILIPFGDLAARSMVMHAWCDGRGLVYRTRGDKRREATAFDHVRVCFANGAEADAFCAQFGGERITIEPQR
jgi:hypothetical protein